MLVCDKSTPEACRAWVRVLSNLLNTETMSIIIQKKTEGLKPEHGLNYIQNSSSLIRTFTGKNRAGNYIKSLFSLSRINYLPSQGRDDTKELPHAGKATTHFQDYAEDI